MHYILYSYGKMYQRKENVVKEVIKIHVHVLGKKMHIKKEKIMFKWTHTDHNYAIQGSTVFLKRTKQLIWGSLFL